MMLWAATAPPAGMSSDGTSNEGAAFLAPNSICNTHKGNVCTVALHCCLFFVPPKLKAWLCMAQPRDKRSCVMLPSCTFQSLDTCLESIQECHDRVKVRVLKNLLQQAIAACESCRSLFGAHLDPRLHLHWCGTRLDIWKLAVFFGVHLRNTYKNTAWNPQPKHTEQASNPKAWSECSLKPVSIAQSEGF